MKTQDAGTLSHSALSVGAVTLNIKKPDIMVPFYRDVLGLDLMGQTDSETELGMHGSVLVRLISSVRLPESLQSHAGLYHFALVFSSRSQLSRTIQHVISETPHLFTGSADHLVSEAFYFSDPEGNGIELYYDRDRNQWQWENGRVQMASYYIDPAEYIERYIALEETDARTRMGHIHLKVGDIGTAKEFYADILGFDITAELPGALFVSVGGYHHHIGMNTWESYGAIERDPSLGLHSYELIISSGQDVQALKKRLEAHNVPVADTDRGISFSDPWNNLITVSSSSGV